ncbi:type IV toxin-antitoxin system AbiEi family antitoxin domain-containing protein [Microcella sp.]|uniref:type IV toxin-antitoxin system AbiEi family antitoxin domain-containing protein n=1 Tax=Microcella sp. TaxID=1913979 RepID=UPI003F6FB701
MDPTRLVQNLGGFARRSTLLAAGAAPRQLASAVHRGVLVRPRRGLYAHPSVGARQIHAASHGGALTCGAALAEHGVWLRDPPHQCVVLLEQGHAIRHLDCDQTPVLHRRRHAPRFGLDDPVDALHHFVVCAADDEARACAVESCLSLGLLTKPDLDALSRGLPRRLRDVVSWCGASAGSGLETMVRRRLSMLGIIAQSQVELPGVGAVDLLIGDRLVIELDGRSHHSREKEFHQDRERDAQTVLLGGTTLRFSSSQVLHELDAVVGTIRAAMSRGEHLTRSLLLASGPTRRWETTPRRVPRA